MGHRMQAADAMAHAEVQGPPQRGATPHHFGHPRSVAQVASLQPGTLFGMEPVAKQPMAEQPPAFVRFTKNLPGVPSGFLIFKGCLKVTDCLGGFLINRFLCCFYGLHFTF